MTWQEWTRKEGKRTTVGITEKARKEIGTIVSVLLPQVGQKIEKGDEVVVLESTKAAIDSYAPLSGTVVAINERLLEDLESLNHHPEGAGWLYQVEGGA